MPTAHPDPDYEPAMALFGRYAEELRLPMRRLDLAPRKPIAIITWAGTDPSLPSVVLNSVRCSAAACTPGPVPWTRLGDLLPDCLTA